MVWAGISLRGCTDLYVIQNGCLTSVRYRDEILHAIVSRYAGATGLVCILTDDNARPHRATVVQQYLQAETIDRMDWPARSPDLSPIEHTWDLLQAAVSARPVQPGTALMEEWAGIPQRRLTSLIKSMRRRCQAAIRARGRHTRY